MWFSLRETFTFSVGLTDLPYWFFLFPFSTLPGDEMTQLGPTGEDECAGQTDTKMMRKIKKEGEKTGWNAEKRRKWQEGLVSWLIRGALSDPWPWSWPRRLPLRSEVVWKCQCGNSLHCWVMILHSLPRLSDMISVGLCLQAPKGHASISTTAHRAH